MLYCLHSLAGGNQSNGISEKMLETELAGFGTHWSSAALVCVLIVLEVLMAVVQRI